MQSTNLCDHKTNYFTSSPMLSQDGQTGYSKNTKQDDQK